MLIKVKLRNRTRPGDGIDLKHGQDGSLVSVDIEAVTTSILANPDFVGSIATALIGDSTFVSSLVTDVISDGSFTDAVTDAATSAATAAVTAADIPGQIADALSSLTSIGLGGATLSKQTIAVCNSGTPASMDIAGTAPY